MEHFNQIIRLFLKNTFFLMFLPVAVMGVLYYALKDTPREYEVQSKFLFDFGGKSTNISGEEFSQHEMYTEFQNMIEIIKSKKLVEKVRSQVAFESLYDSSDVFDFEWPVDSKIAIGSYLMEILNDQRPPYLDDSDEAEIIKAFYDFHKLYGSVVLNAISARRVMSSEFLQIDMTYTDPDKLYYLSNLLNTLIVNEIETLNKKNIGRQKSIIEELLKKAKKELDEKVQELEELKVKNSIINLPEHTKAIVGYLVQLEGIRSNIKSQLASSKSAEKSIRDGIDQESFITNKRPENEDLLSKKDELYTAQDLKIVHLQNDVDYGEILRQQKVINENQLGIKSNLDELSRAVTYDPNQVHTDLTMQFINYKISSDKLSDQLTIIENEIARVGKYAAYFAPFESQISSLRDEIYTAQRTYLLFLNKLNLTESLEFDAATSKLSLIDPPEYPYSPKPSKVLLVIIAGGIVVFILLAAFIVITYLLDNSIKDVRTFERRFNRPVIAALPAIVSSKDEVLSKAISLIEKEGAKKMAQAIGERKTIAINSLSSREELGNTIKALKKCWKGEKVKVMNFTKDEGDIAAKILEVSKNYDRVVCTSNPLQFSYDGFEVAKASACDFLHFTLGRVKNQADDRVLRDYPSNATNHLGFIVNDLKPDYMDSYIGELPKRRNMIRRIFKKLINGDFTWKR